MMFAPTVYGLDDQDLQKLETDIKVDFPEGSYLLKASYMGWKDPSATFYVQVPKASWEQLEAEFSKYKRRPETSQYFGQEERRVVTEYELDLFSQNKINYVATVLEGENEYIVVVNGSPVGYKMDCFKKQIYRFQFRFEGGY